jgi:pyruvate carboxylase
MVGRGLSPVQAYLAEDEIIAVCVREGVHAVHPGYGFLSESDTFARKVIQAGLTWIGPPPDTMKALGNKAAARDVAKGCGVPIVPGSDGPVPTAADAVKFVEQFGLPVILKACSGGL